MTSLSDWRLDLGNSHRGSSIAASDHALNPSGYATNFNVAHAHAETEDSTEQQSRLARKKTWDVAMGPVKALPMNAFMMYMAGRAVSIFPIMMVGMMLWRPAKALLSVNATFQPLESEETGSLIINKIVFIAGNLGAIALAIYKVHSMGLLPNTPSDWLEFLPPIQRAQFALASESFV